MKKSEYLCFNDGIISIYNVINTADDGDRPAETLDLKRTVRFENRTVGMQRYYAAMQNQIKISKMILIPDCSGVNVLDVVKITGDTQQYQIEQVQRRTDTKPYSMQLSLSALFADYEMED